MATAASAAVTSAAAAFPVTCSPVTARGRSPLPTTPTAGQSSVAACWWPTNRGVRCRCRPNHNSAADGWPRNRIGSRPRSPSRTPLRCRPSSCATTTWTTAGARAPRLWTPAATVSYYRRPLRPTDTRRPLRRGAVVRHSTLRRRLGGLWKMIG